MEIKEAIKARIERFNQLWLKAVGYTFEEEPKILEDRYAEKIKEWQPKADELAQQYNFDNFEAYINFRYEEFGDNDRKIEVLENIWDEKPSYPAPLYDYEIMVINQSESVANFIIEKSKEYNEDIKDTWNRYAKDEKDEYVTSFQFVKNIQSDGYQDWNSDHSGNSGNASITFANCLLFNIEIFPYLHGALAGLVGDKGYHDDRKDIPKFDKK